jgi:drug/metabolite transporter (DMT)-like permease|tara:strand:- start:237 stop:1118 length:882 start_codon:yes stop_codon:yes gene_type:complete
MSKNQKTSLLKVIFFATTGFFILVCQDSTAKYLGTMMPLNQVIWGRFFFHFVMILILFAILKPKIDLKNNFKINIIRSILMVFATFFFIHSLQKFDLVDIYVVFFSAPLIVSILTAIFLKDILSPKGIILMLLSFSCIIYSMSPSMKILSIDLIFPLVPPVCWALYQFFTKFISGNNDPLVALFYAAVVGAILFTIYVILDWTPIENKNLWIGLVILGILGFTSHLLIIFAIQFSNLSFVTNFQYSQLIWSTLINFYIFGVPFDFNKSVGVIGIIIFGILFVRTEGKKNKIKT